MGARAAQDPQRAAGRLLPPPGAVGALPQEQPLLRAAEPDPAGAADRPAHVLTAHRAQVDRLARVGSPAGPGVRSSRHDRLVPTASPSDARSSHTHPLGRTAYTTCPVRPRATGRGGTLGGCPARPTTADLRAPATGDGNNTAAYVRRSGRGQTSWSQHAYGTAVYITPSTTRSSGVTWWSRSWPAPTSTGPRCASACTSPAGQRCGRSPTSTGPGAARGAAAGTTCPFSLSGG